MIEEKKDFFPGFEALSEQVYIRHPDAQSEAVKRPTDPRAVLIYSWGDGQPKNLVKYADGYRNLFPCSTQIVVLAPISKAMWSNLDQRTLSMRPVIDAIFPKESEDDEDSQKVEDRVLAHIMSNTGGINYAATLNAYRLVHDKPMPHHLLVLDSTPGSVIMTRENLGRWSRAMALGTANWFPWPFAVTQTLWAGFLCGNRFIEWVIGKEPAPAFSVKAVINPYYETKDTRHLYIYSEDDDIIPYQDIEEHIAQARKRGYKSDNHMFKGSGHVRHMQMFNEEYWGAIGTSWNRATSEPSDEA
ncbi:DUF829 domain-containing protein [Trichoderma camerunense]